MADTIGDLIDKLTIANIRLWHLEDSKRENPSEEVSEKISNTNKERNSLIDQINAAMRVLTDGNNSTFQVDAETLLGTGKNKFYKGE